VLPTAFFLPRPENRQTIWEGKQKTCCKSRCRDISQSFPFSPSLSYFLIFPSSSSHFPNDGKHVLSQAPVQLRFVKSTQHPYRERGGRKRGASQTRISASNKENTSALESVKTFFDEQTVCSTYILQVTNRSDPCNAPPRLIAVYTPLASVLVFPFPSLSLVSSHLPPFAGCGPPPRRRPHHLLHSRPRHHCRHFHHLRHHHLP